MLWEAEIPTELCDKAVLMTQTLVKMVNTLRSSVRKISSDPTQAINKAKRVEEIEHIIDTGICTKSLFVKYGPSMNKCNRYL